MKRIYVAGILLLIAIGLCVAEYVSVRNCTDEYTNRIDKIELMVESDNMKKAAFAARETEKNWEETINIIDMLLFHDYVDDIGRNLAKLESYIEKEELAEFFATCEEAKEQLRSLEESELPVARNVI
ncbi:MAG: DUF4363 family protein [Ruminococcaceae bacterium]|nr:DUF4363 family protein [Oscillospiraceae bacterium]